MRGGRLLLMVFEVCVCMYWGPRGISLLGWRVIRTGLRL